MSKTKNGTAAAAKPAAKKVAFVLTASKRIRGKDVAAGTVLGSVSVAGGFRLDDLRKALAAGQAALR